MCILVHLCGVLWRCNVSGCYWCSLTNSYFRIMRLTYMGGFLGVYALLVLLSGFAVSVRPVGVWWLIWRAFLLSGCRWCMLWYGFIMSTTRQSGQDQHGFSQGFPHQNQRQQKTQVRSKNPPGFAPKVGLSEYTHMRAGKPKNFSGNDRLSDRHDAYITYI